MSRRNFGLDVDDDDREVFDLAGESPLYDFNAPAAAHRLADTKGSMWLDVRLPELPHADEFVCDRCWLVTHVSRQWLKSGTCVECV